MHLTELPSFAEAFKLGSVFSHPGLHKLYLIRGDITALKGIDAIVNAANSALRGGGGVDGAIHKAAGPELLKECQSIGGCPTGSAVITKGYKLSAKHVIHTVGPQKENPDQLRSCYTNSLALLEQYGLTSIAFSCISTGVYGYPEDAAASIAIGEVESYLRNSDYGMQSVNAVVFVVFTASSQKIYQQKLQALFRQNSSERRKAKLNYSL